MRNRTILALIAVTGVVNGLYLETVPAWRQLLFAVLVVAAYLHGRHLPGRRDWLHAIHCAISGTFKPELDPFEATAWRGVPRWYYDQHAPAVKVAVAGERAAWKRSIGRHIETSAHADDQASRF